MRGTDTGDLDAMLEDVKSIIIEAGESPREIESG